MYKHFRLSKLNDNFITIQSPNRMIYVIKKAEFPPPFLNDYIKYKIAIKCNSDAITIKICQII